MTTTPTVWFSGSYDPRFADILATPDGGFRLDWGNNSRPHKGGWDEALRYAPSGELAGTDKIILPSYKEVVSRLQNVLLTNGEVGLSYIDTYDVAHQHYVGTASAYVGGHEARLSSVGADVYMMFEAVALDNGGLLSLWGQTVGNDDLRQLMFRRVSDQGEAIGQAVSVPSENGHEQLSGAMAELADGTIVIGWTDRLADADTGDVMVQRYGQDGVALGDPLTLASVSYYNPIAITSLAGGGYVVVWGDGPDTASTLQLFAADGTAQGGPVAVDGWTNGAITELQDGGFVLVVEKADYQHFIQRFDANGAPLGDPIASDYGYLQTLDDGRFVFADATGYTIYDPRESAINGTAGNDVIYGRLDGSEIFGMEGNDTLVGGDAVDILHGGVGDDKIQGRIGADTLFGGEGNDSLGGGLGADVLDGGGGDDVMRSSNGDDVLIGAGGADTMHGGTGADVFVYERANDTGIDAASRDLIIGFETKKDQIDLHLIDADRLHAGQQAFTFIGSAEFTDVGQLRFEVQGGFTVIEADLNGDHEADMTIALKGDVVLNAYNFILTHPPSDVPAGGHVFLASHAPDWSHMLPLA